MKKKNVVGHMVASKNATQGWFRRLNILPRVLCLLIAVAIWLLVVNVMPSEKDGEQARSLSVSESVEG